jgi:hypothetical protein
MPCLAQPSPEPSPPQLVAGLLLAARPHLERLGFPHPTVEAVLEATGAGRARAYELKDAIEAALPALLRPVGRPPAPPKPEIDTSAISRAVAGFLMDHPGSVYGGKVRRNYTDDFRCFVLELRAQHGELDCDQFATAVGVPLKTLQEWWRDPRPPRPSKRAAVEAGPDPTAPQLESILCAWDDWHGPFDAFVEHVNRHLGIPYRHTLIARILFAYRKRMPKRRGGRSPDEKALRGAFQTFFAGAQWVADGSGIVVDFNGERFAFNLELAVDAHTDAFVGASVRDEEDAKAVQETFEDGKATSAAPIALLLDNRACNDTAEVQALCDANDTILLHATKGRPQNDAHVEGGFGLFKTTVPPIVITGSTPREIAASILRHLVMVWGRTVNHRPRLDRQGRSRFQLYQEGPTPEQIQAARAALEERRRRQQRARETLLARQDPQVRVLLDAAFARLGLADPTGNHRSAIARYPLQAILAGIAIFEGKRRVGTLPPDVDGRYLFGIVRNVSEKEEGIAIAEALWRLRLEARDLIFRGLEHERDEVLADVTAPADRVKVMMDRALDAPSELYRTFWLSTAAATIAGQPEHTHEPLYNVAARRIHSAFRVPHPERLEMARWLAAKLLPTS